MSDFNIHHFIWDFDTSFIPSHLSRLFTVFFSKLMNKLTNQSVSNLNNHNQANYQFSFNLIFPSSNSTHHPDIPFLILFSLLRTSLIFIHSSTHCNLISWNSLCKCLYYFVLFDFFLNYSIWFKESNITPHVLFHLPVFGGNFLKCFSWCLLPATCIPCYFFIFQFKPLSIDAVLWKIKFFLPCIPPSSSYMHICTLCLLYSCHNFVIFW